VIIRNLRAILAALLVPFFTEVVLRPLDAFHLGKKFVGKDCGGSDWVRFVFQCHKQKQPSPSRIAEDLHESFNLPASHCVVMRFPNESWRIACAEGYWNELFSISSVTARIAGPGVAR
jgi:hypothetical protein